MSTATITNRFVVPTREEVSPQNRAIFDKLQQSIGMVPNLYAFFANSPTALADYLAVQNRKSSLRPKEREVINLVVSQVNECEYCLSAHTVIGKLNGFTDEQIIDIRIADVDFDTKLAALATFVREVTLNRGKPSETSVNALIEAGYTNESIVDIIMVIGDKTISNLLHGVTQLAIDFPVAPRIDSCGCGHDSCSTRVQ